MPRRRCCVIIGTSAQVRSITSDYLRRRQKWLLGLASVPGAYCGVGQRVVIGGGE